MAAHDRRTRVRCRRLSVAALSMAGLVISPPIAGHAEPPGDAPTDPFPEMAQITAWYKPLPADDFVTPNYPGIWFNSPSGQTCGIWDRGNFGCTGDIPGAPPGDDHIAWLNGNRAVHHGWTAAIQFPAGHADRMLPARSYVTRDSTTCAITPDGNTFCGHGEFKFLITPEGTWFKGWNDRRSYVCNYYNSCPPG